MSGPSFPNENQHKMMNMKRPLTLDLNQVKKNNLMGIGTSVLSSPDLNMLKVDTPELEKMILNNGMVNTPTPSLLYPSRGVTEEQESFATGFVTALNNLHNSNSHGNNSY